MNCSRSCSIRFFILFKRTVAMSSWHVFCNSIVFTYTFFSVQFFHCTYIPYVLSPRSISLSFIYLTNARLYCVCVHYTTTYTSTCALTNLSLCCAISQMLATQNLIHVEWSWLWVRAMAELIVDRSYYHYCGLHGHCSRFINPPLATFPTCVWIVVLRQAEAGRSTFLALSSLYSLSLVSRTFEPVTLRVNSVSL